MMEVEALKVALWGVLVTITLVTMASLYRSASRKPKPTPFFTCENCDFQTGDIGTACVHATDSAGHTLHRVLEDGVEVTISVDPDEE